MEMHITKGYTPDDISPLHRLENKCFSKAFRWKKEDLAEALTLNDVWIGRYDGKIVGCVLIEFKRGTGHIISLNIDPKYRRKGFAQALMEKAEDFYKTAGMKRMWLGVHVDNPAQILYFKLGYRVIGVKHNYYSDGSNAVIMKKLILK